MILCGLRVLEILQLCDRLPSPTGQSGVDCGMISSMPNVSFTIGGKVFTLPAEQVIFQPTFPVNPLKLH